MHYIAKLLSFWPSCSCGDDHGCTNRTGPLYTRGDGGNAAAVVLPEENAALNDHQRTAVAAAIGFSETVFVSSISKNGDAGEVDIALRYITPTEEVDLCGHATVACLGLLHDKQLLLGTYRGRLLTRAGTVSFLVEPSDLPEVHMSQLPVTVDAPLEAEVAERLGAALQARLDMSWPPRVASTGLRDILVAIESEEELAGMTPSMPAVKELSEELQVVGVHAFVLPGASREDKDVGGLPPTAGASPTKTRCIRVRNFAPLFGIDEESATGTSNCALACALSLDRPEVAGPGQVVLFSQGDGMGQPSRICVRLPREASGEPWVGGCFKVCESRTVQIADEVKEGGGSGGVS